MEIYRARIGTSVSRRRSTFSGGSCPVRRTFFSSALRKDTKKKNEPPPVVGSCRDHPLALRRLVGYGEAARFVGRNHFLDISKERGKVKKFTKSSGPAFMGVILGGASHIQRHVYGTTSALQLEGIVGSKGDMASQA